jgi:Spy/CpxP family protein refolding chaperone
MVAVGAVLSTASYAFSALAMHPKDDRGDQQRHVLEEQLNLSDEQRSLFEDMHGGTPARQDKRARIDKHEQLRHIAQQDAFDAEKAKQIAEDIGREASDTAFQRAQSLHMFYASLNDEQRAIFNAHHEKRQSLRHEKRKSVRHENTASEREHD